jgi:hypothetical protein
MNAAINRAKSDRKIKEIYPLETRAEWIMKAYFTYHEVTHDRVKQVVIAAYKAGYAAGGTKYRSRQRKMMKKIKTVLEESF